MYQQVFVHTIGENVYSNKVTVHFECPNNTEIACAFWFDKVELLCISEYNVDILIEALDEIVRKLIF